MRLPDLIRNPGSEEVTALDSETRTRVRMLERHEVPQQLVELYDRLREQRGVVPNMFKTIAHTPDLAVGIAAFLKPLMGEGALPGWYKELVATRVAILQNCDY